MLSPPARILLALGIVAITVALIVAGFRTGIVGHGAFGWFWLVIIVAIGVYDLSVYAVRGRSPWPVTRRPRTPGR